MSKPDYSTWYAKQQAADLIGISTKQLDRWAEEKRLQRAKWKRPGGGPWINVYHPGDVDRLSLARAPKPGPFVLPDEADAPKPATNGHAVAVRQPAGAEFIQAIAAAVTSAVRTSETCLSRRLYLTIDEAAEYTGLGVEYLRRRIAEGQLERVKGAGPHGADVVRRTDLEKL